MHIFCTLNFQCGGMAWYALLHIHNNFQGLVVFAKFINDEFPTLYIIYRH